MRTFFRLWNNKLEKLFATNGVLENFEQLSKLFKKFFLAQRQETKIDHTNY